MSKKTSIILYTVYSILLVLIITFADGIGRWVSDSFEAMILKKDITDVVIDMDTDVALDAKATYELSYSVLGSYVGNPGITFESTNIEALNIVTGLKPTIRTYAKFDGDETNVDVIIRSTLDTDFEKIVTFKVRKLYPSSDDVTVGYLVRACGYGRSNLTLGVSIFPYSNVTDNSFVNEYEILYDSEYIRYDEESGAYVPIKETPEGVAIHFTVVYPNGATADSRSFVISAANEVESFDDIRVSGDAVEEIYVNKGGSIAPILYSNGKTIMSGVDISYTNAQNVKIAYTGAYTLSEVGDYLFTFTLPNGFSKTLLVHARNVISLPELKSALEVQGNKIIVPNNVISAKVELDYPDGITYDDVEIETDGDAAKVTTAWRSIYIYPKKIGNTTVKLTWDDGYERLECEYVIEVIKANDIVAQIEEGIKFFVSKILGHATLFAMLAVFTIFMFKNLEFNSNLVEGLIYFLSVLPTAVSTEVIQSFTPGRHARVVDVMIDACGFLFGTIVCTLVMYFKSKKLYRNVLSRAANGKDKTTNEIAV